METLRTNIQKWLDKQDKSWRALSSGRQRNYTLCFFLAYLMLTAAVFLKIWHDMAGPGSTIVIEHIGRPVSAKESPFFQSDTLSTISKENIYERK